jgi:hypothetical protein
MPVDTNPRHWNKENGTTTLHRPRIERNDSELIGTGKIFLTKEVMLHDEEEEELNVPTLTSEEQTWRKFARFFADEDIHTKHSEEELTKQLLELCSWWSDEERTPIAYQNAATRMFSRDDSEDSDDEFPSAAYIAAERRQWLAMETSSGLTSSPSSKYATRLDTKMAALRFDSTDEEDLFGNEGEKCHGTSVANSPQAKPSQSPKSAGLKRMRSSFVFSGRALDDDPSPVPSPSKHAIPVSATVAKANGEEDFWGDMANIAF